MYIKKLTQSLTLTLSLSLLLILVGKVFADTQSISDIPYNVIRITDGSSKDYQPEFSPDGKQIVFIKEISNSEGIKSGEFWHKTPYYMNLWLMDSDGKNRRQLTSGEVQDFAPMFTTDGKSIIFVSNRKHGNRWDIWSINVDGSNLTRITEIEKNELWERIFYPSPTPDGKGMLFVVYQEGHPSVWLMDMESRAVKRITSGGTGDDTPVMSPDGKDIVFKTYRLGAGGIWSIDRSGKNYKRLTYKYYREFYPAWSPNGTKISYVTYENGIFDLWIMDRDGRNKKRLIKSIPLKPSDFWSEHPIESGYYRVSWHPYGTKLALTLWDQDKKESYLTLFDFEKDITMVSESLSDETESLKDYTLIGEKDISGDGNWDDFGPSFSPDGKTILFASNRKGNWGIWSLGADGEGLKQITKGSGDDIAPVFSPDGKEIAFLKKTEDKKLRSLEDEKLKSTTSQPLNLSTSVISTYDLWIMNSDGSVARQVTKGISIISYPAWNPNGKEIAFITKGDKGHEIQFISLNKDSVGGVSQAYTVNRLISIWDIENDNSAISLFEKNEDFTSNKKYKIAKMQHFLPEVKNPAFILSRFIKGEAVTLSYPLKEFLYKASYNTSGDKIIFESNRTGNIDIWSVKRDGTELTRITKGNGPHLNPVFSPDNKKIAFAHRKEIGVSISNTTNYNIWIADVQTDEEMMINGEEQTDWNPVFSPDGKKIAYVTNRSGDFKHYNIWMLYLK